MSRIDDAFACARAEGRKPLILYLTACDPDLETSHRLLVAAAGAGADILELGVPWSDPSADGIAIQAAMRRALKSGGGLRTTLELCRSVRAVNPSVGIVLFGYANPIVVRGPDAFCKDARQAGADGVLCVDWPAEEDPALTQALRAEGLDFIPLIAPTSTPQRIRAHAAAARGFLYYVSFTGITGAKLSDIEGPRRHVAEIRQISAAKLPIAVGFGISSPQEAKAVASFADAVVVGSAAVRVIEQTKAAGRDPVADMATFVGSLRGALGQAV